MRKNEYVDVSRKVIKDRRNKMSLVASEVTVVLFETRVLGGI